MGLTHVVKCRNNEKIENQIELEKRLILNSIMKVKGHVFCLVMGKDASERQEKYSFVLFLNQNKLQLCLPWSFLLLSGRASERGTQRTQVLSIMGPYIYFDCPALRKRRKKMSLLQNCSFFYLFRFIESKIAQKIVLREQKLP